MFTTWQEMFGGLKGLGVNAEKGVGALSPVAISVADQFIESESSLGGVPVFNLETLNPETLKALKP